MTSTLRYFLQFSPVQVYIEEFLTHTTTRVLSTLYNGGPDSLVCKIGSLFMRVIVSETDTTYSPFSLALAAPVFLIAKKISSRLHEGKLSPPNVPVLRTIFGKKPKWISDNPNLSRLYTGLFSGAFTWLFLRPSYGIGARDIVRIALHTHVAHLLGANRSKPQSLEMTWLGKLIPLFKEKPLDPSNIYFKKEKVVTYLQFDISRSDGISDSEEGISSSDDEKKKEKIDENDKKKDALDKKDKNEKKKKD